MQTGGAEHFDTFGTLGIEEEYYIVDADGHPRSGIDELIYESNPPDILEGRLDHELFKFTIETQTPVIPSLDQAGARLAEMRDALVAHAETHGFNIATAGLHPTAKWRELEHAEKPRYRSQLDRIQYPQHRNITAGLHIHVGVDDADMAVWIANEIRWYLPVVLALSANSPFWCGTDTGLHSARAKIFENLPNTGIPTRFESYQQYDAFERTMVEQGAIADRGELWFDVRPHSELGTVEVRTPDAQVEEWRVLALAEYIHALVVDLADQYQNGAEDTRMRRELLDENKWRAMRHGRDTELITPDGTDTESIESIVVRDAERLDIDGILELWGAESGTERQRRLYDNGGFEAVRASLMLT